LNPADNPLCQVRNEEIRAHGVPFAGVMADDELCAGVQGQERVKVPAFLVTSCGAALPNGNTAPKLVDLAGRHGQAAYAFIQEPGALLASHAEHFKNGVNVAISQPCTSPDADAFGEKFYDLNSLVMIQAKPVQRLRFAESRSAK
jgi:hypothetical protein